ncbi:MAG: nucleotidyltransferase family protein [Bacteroidales bacterium]|nr:nucleotidyltransferase family protein [Bacteroidales bacterium]
MRQLLTAAVRGSESPLIADMDEAQWETVLGVCAAQNVHTLVFDCLPKSVPKEILNLWRGQTEAVRKHNRLLSSVREAQERAWKAGGLNYSLLKGESVAVMYPNPERRGSGDIDWYFGDRESWTKAVDLARKNTENGLHEDSDGDVSFKYRGTVTEYHRDWTHLASRKLRKLAGPPRIIDGRLSPEDTILMLICHILHHMAYAGMGLKQYADLAVALEGYDGQYDKAALASRILGLGLEGWTSLLLGSIAYLFGTSEEVMPMAPSKNSGDVGRLLEIVFEDGCNPVGRRIGLGMLLRKLSLMGKYCPREMYARYFHLIAGRLSRKKFA